MKLTAIWLVAVSFLAPLAAANLDGVVNIHDPSTLVQEGGRYYTYGTGGTSLVSDDGWTWRRGTPLPRRGLAPDVISIGGRYFLYIAANIGAQPKAAINLLTNKTLDPSSPDYKWEEGGVVASSDGIEDCNAIDPGVFLDPNDGRLWLVYGSYFGYIRLVELDPKTGKRRFPNTPPVNIAINSEASIMIFQDGWYYLLVTHGSCCRGADSGYNIRMGRARKVTGPFLDNMGIDMLQGGGKLFAASAGRVIGPGHFGLLDLGQGVQKFSLHYEADLDRGGASVLDIRPLLWKDGWPVAGDHLRAGTYQFESLRTGTTLEAAVEGFPVGGRPTRRGPPPGMGGPPPGAGGAPPGAGGPPPGGFPAGGLPPGGPPPGGMFAGIGRPIPDQDVNEVAKKWPTGTLQVRMANYLSQAQQKWTIEAAPGAGGYPGAPYYRITIAGTGRALTATADAELAVAPEFTGAPEQLWRIDQLADGSYRIMPKAVPNTNDALALSAVGSSFATLSKFDPKSEKQRWWIKTP